jgi:predicted ATPase/DNA-binding CsgD family transcriptional regulator
MTTSTITRLPQPPTPFLGREEDLNRLETMLRDPGCQLVTLAGYGGIGKTRLALELTSRLADEFPDGACFVQLQPVDSVGLVPAAICDALGLMAHSQSDIWSLLLRYLYDRTLLLTLDNLEHLLDAVDLVAELLDAAPGVKLLVTSREVLNLRQEWAWHMTGLDIPQEASGEDPASASAVRLFIDNARRIRPNFVPENEMDGIVRICRLLEGVPLAIELAASWTRLLSCDEVAAEIQRGLDFLNSSMRDIPERHRSMRAVFDHSWTLLSETERDVFCRLSVFRDGFDRDAAKHVAGATLPLLSSLMDKSLIRRDANGRCMMHWLLRQYAEDHLATSPEGVSHARDAHSAYYADFLSNRTYGINGGRQIETVQEIRREHSNIRAALRHAIQERRVDDLKRGFYTYTQFSDFQGNYQEVIEIEGEAASILDDSAADDRTLGVAAIIYVAKGWHLIRIGDFDGAWHSFHRARIINAELHSELLPAFATDPVAGLALVANVRGNYDVAMELAEESRAHAEERDDLYNLQTALYVLASTAYAQGDFVVALDYARHCYAVTMQLENDWMMAYALVILGDLARMDSDFDSAREYYQQSHDIRRAFHDPEGMALTQNRLARVHWLEGRYAEARDLLRENAAAYRQIGDSGGLAASLLGLGDVSRSLRRFSDAARYYRESLEIAEGIRWQPFVLSVLASVGELLLDVDESEPAVALLTLVQNHASTDAPARTRAGNRLERTRSALDPALVSRATKRPEAQALESACKLANDRLRYYESQAVADALPTGHVSAAGDGLLDPLSDRELEILSLLAEGLTNQEIADRLTLVVGTVKSHNHHIFSKMGVRNRVGAIARARELRLI